MATRYSQYSEEQKDKIRLRAKQWQIDNREEYNLKARERYHAAKGNPNSPWAKASRKYREIHPERALLRSAKIRAKNKNLEFSIDEGDIIIPEKCPYLGMDLSMDRTTNKNIRPSLDRIDPSKGYIKGNIQVISWRANMLKNNSSAEELLLLALKMLGEI